jgi:predicted O-methyltransferase YrrM
MDWADDPPATLVARVLRRLRRGSIVLFHDTLWSALAPAYRDRAPTRAAVARLVDELGAAGFRCLTVPELLALGRPVRWPWSRRAHPESWGTAAEEGPASDV